MIGGFMLVSTSAVLTLYDRYIEACCMLFLGFGTYCYLAAKDFQRIQAGSSIRPTGRDTSI